MLMLIKKEGHHVNVDYVCMYVVITSICYYYKKDIKLIKVLVFNN